MHSQPEQQTTEHVEVTVNRSASISSVVSGKKRRLSTDATADSEGGNESIDLYEKFRREITKRGFRIHEVPNDGDCGLHAIAHQLSVLHQVETDVDSLRSQAVSYLRSGQIQFEQFLNLEVYTDTEQYIEKQSSSGEWIDEIILRSLAHCLACDIRILNENGEETVLRADESSHADMVVTIGHISELHYVSLVLDDGIESNSSPPSARAWYDDIRNENSLQEFYESLADFHSQVDASTDDSFLTAVTDVLFGNKKTKIDIKGIIERSAASLPPKNCLSLDCEYRLVRDGEADECSLHLRQLAVVSSSRQAIMNVYIRDPPGSLKTHDDSIPVNCTLVNEESDAIRMLKEKIDEKTIVIVHDYKKDFKHLFIEPSLRVRDTSTIPLYQELIGEEPRGHIGLKILAEKLLGRVIQTHMIHDALEDAMAAMDLYLLAHHDIENQFLLDPPVANETETSVDSSQEEEELLPPPSKKTKLYK